MASVITKTANLLGAGRSRVTLIGYDKNDSKIELELDLVETFDTTYNNKISNHAIEKDLKDPVSNIVDHVMPENPTISSNCILSDNLNLISTNAAQSAKDKLKQLIYWQKSGSMLIMEGYTVGSSAFGKVLDFLNRGIGNFNSDLEEPYYAGIVTDKIENIVLGNIVSRNKTTLGNDIEVTLNFQRVIIAEALTITRAKTKLKMKNKGNVKTKTVIPKKDIKKSGLKKF